MHHKYAETATNQLLISSSGRTTLSSPVLLLIQIEGNGEGVSVNHPSYKRYHVIKNPSRRRMRSITSICRLSFAPNGIKTAVLSSDTESVEFPDGEIAIPGVMNECTPVWRLTLASFPEALTSKLSTSPSPNVHAI